MTSAGPTRAGESAGTGQSPSDQQTQAATAVDRADYADFPGPDARSEHSGHSGHIGHIGHIGQTLTASRSEAHEGAYTAVASGRAAGHGAAEATTQTGSRANTKSGNWAATRSDHRAAGPVGRPVEAGRVAPVAAVGAPKTRRRPRRAGLTQIMCWQVGLVTVVSAVRQPWPLATAMIVAAAMVIASTAVPVRGRWAYQWAGLWLGFVRRRSERDLPDPAGPALLRLMSPEAVAVPGELFMLSRAGGATAVLQPSGEPSVMPPAAELLPGADEALAFAAQVIRHAGTDRRRAPRTWIALQAVRTVDVHRDDDVQRVLGNAVRRALRRLRDNGLPSRVLVEHEVFGTLAALAHVNAGRGRVREAWRNWRSGPVIQVTFRLGAAAGLSDRLLAVAPGVAVTLAVTACRLPAQAEAVVEATVRIAALDLETLERAASEVERIAGEQGIAVERLDGRHGRGMAATLPIGGV